MSDNLRGFIAENVISVGIAQSVECRTSNHKIVLLNLPAVLVVLLDTLTAGLIIPRCKIGTWKMWREYE